MVAAMAQEIADHRYDPKSMIGPPDTVADVIEDYRDLIEFAPGVVPGANTEATRLCPHCEEEQISLSRPCCRPCENRYRADRGWDSLEELEARLIKALDGDDDHGCDCCQKEEVSLELLDEDVEGPHSRIGRFGEIPLLRCAGVPEGEIRFVDGEGNELGRIINVGQRDD